MKVRYAVLGGVMVMLAGASAWAGAKDTLEVVVDTVGQSASGALGAARASADTQQVIGCHTRGTSTYQSLFCQARDAAGTYVSCTSSDPTLISIGQSMAGDSYVRFMWDANGSCTYLYVSHGSQHPPKQP